MIEFLEAIRDFTETGGQVLLVIGLLIFVMWLLILERAISVLGLCGLRTCRSLFLVRRAGSSENNFMLTMRLNGTIIHYWLRFV